MPDTLTIEDLARFTREPVDHLRDWQSRGIIGEKGAGAFTAEDIEKIRLVEIFLRRGVNLDVIEAAARQFMRTGLLFTYTHDMFPAGIGSVYSLAEAAESAGLELELLRRLWEASGMHEQGEMLYHDDVQMLAQLKKALAAGFPEEALVQLLRVYSDALGRVAETETRLFRFYIRERLLASGVSGDEFIAAIDSIGNQVGPLIEPAVLYFHRKGFIRGIREQVAWHLEEMVGGWKPAESPGQMLAAIAFIDLASFTPLAEAMGDVAAAGVLERFAGIVRHSTSVWGGRVVKQIGDAFMLVFPEPRSALACALEVHARASKESHFPAVRGGIQWGSLLYREGDYVGSNVNIASRIAAEAKRHQILITAEVRREVAGLPGVEFVRLGKRRLKGLTGEMELFEARPSVEADAGRVTDPVCGMELGIAEVAATLTLDGRERAFCSQECLRRFVAAPSEYTG